MKLTLRRSRPILNWRDFPGPGGAILSFNKQHRLILWRRWGHGDLCVFMMLNPSTADASVDDATSRKCEGFAERWGYDGFVIVNVFTYRATDPTDLLKHVHTLPREANDPTAEVYLDHAIAYAGERKAPFVCAWGATLSGVEHFSDLFAKVLLAPITRHALKVTKSGHPGHPLYIPYETPLAEFSPAHVWGAKLLAGFMEREGDDPD